MNAFVFRKGRIFDIKKLLELTRFLPVLKHMSVVWLIHNLYEIAWENGVQVSQVLQYPFVHKYHAEHIDNSDLSIPIIVDRFLNVIDGMHRLAKCVKYNILYISAVVVTDNDLLEKARIYL